MNEDDDLVGKRIRLLDMPDDPDAIPPGTRGTVRWVSRLATGFTQIAVDWEIARSLYLTVPPDRFEVIEDGPP